MMRNLKADRLSLADTVCQALAKAGTPVQLRGIRQETFETHYVLSPGSGLSVTDILAQAQLIKRTVDQRFTRVRRDNGDVLVIVMRDFELMLILNYLIPLFVPSLLVVNVAAIDRGLNLLFQTAADPLGALIWVVAVVVLDVCLASQVPQIRRRARVVAEQRNDRGR